MIFDCFATFLRLIWVYLERTASHTATNKIGETPVKVAQPFMQQKIEAFVETGAW